jgi:hypothetical protein
MNLGVVNTLLTKATFRFMLLKRAYTQAEFERMIAKTSFTQHDLRGNLIGLDVLLKKTA